MVSGWSGFNSERLSMMFYNYILDKDKNTIYRLDKITN